MDDDFDQSIFTFYFNLMTYLGSWVIETDDRVKKCLYRLYSNAVSAWVLFITYMGILDLIDGISEINKISYNICINLFIIGTWMKTMQIVFRSKKINNLRRSLHRNFKTCKDETEVSIYNDALRDITFITKLFYFCLVTLYPIWFVLSLFSNCWGQREFPLPAKWPYPVDMEDFKSFILISLFHGSFALFYLFQALSIDVSMFGLLAQIHREYRFLIKQIEEFGDFCNNSSNDYDAMIAKKGTLKEINNFLQKAKARHLLRAIIKKQSELFACIGEFQHGYKSSMFIHMFAGGLLLTVNGIQAMIVSFHFDVKMSYQLGYVLVIVSDILYLCWMTNRISTKNLIHHKHRQYKSNNELISPKPTVREIVARLGKFSSAGYKNKTSVNDQCFEVGMAFYTTPWHKMDVDIQKDISFIILRSQNPFRITSGGFLELNLRTFMVFMKNIYSWLALFRQVALK